MPTYDYICKTLNEKFEHFQSMNSPVLKDCPHCKKSECKVQRVVSGGTGLIFKGSGFYLTDYKNKKSTTKENQPKKDTKSENKTKKLKGKNK